MCLNMSRIPLLLLNVVLCSAISRNVEDAAVQKFRKYLQIDTTKEENMHLAVEFWRQQANELDLSFEVHTPKSKPIVVLSWPGTEPSLPSIMLNSHMDVVPVDESKWSYLAFEGYIDENGNIYGRGAQDTKDVSIQYLEAIRKLKSENIKLKRTLHITLMPDEETGGYNGMQAFLNSEEFKILNVGFVLDEGLASSNDVLYVTYQDKRPWQMRFHVKGEGGHGYTMPDETAIERTQRLINAVMEFRDRQKVVMKSSDVLDFGAYTSVNINVLNGGLATNVIPNSFILDIDMRLSTSINITEAEDLVNSWLQAAGNETTVEFLRQENVSTPTPVDNTNYYWSALQEAYKDMGIMIKPIMCPATSDVLYVRNYGIPAYGFAPKSRTISRIHGNDEYLNINTFLKGIDVYQNILIKLGNLL